MSHSHVLSCVCVLCSRVTRILTLFVVVDQCCDLVFLTDVSLLTAGLWDRNTPVTLCDIPAVKTAASHQARFVRQTGFTAIMAELRHSGPPHLLILDQTTNVR